MRPEKQSMMYELNPNLGIIAYGNKVFVLDLTTCPYPALETIQFNNHEDAVDIVEKIVNEENAEWVSNRVAERVASMEVA